MHRTEKQLRRLAEAYVKEELLSDEQIEIKKHMAECDDCYEIFCAQYVLFKQLLESGLLMPEALGDSMFSNVLLKIQKVKSVITVIKEKKDEILPCWDFVRLPQPAAVRGEEGRNQEEEEVFVSRGSEYSVIKCREGKVVIRLDQDVFPVDRLKARICREGEEEICGFSYDEETECYQAEFSADVFADGSVIEIMEAEDGI